MPPKHPPRPGQADVSARALPPYRPQLAKLSRSPPEGLEWGHEIKYDGYRIGIVIERGRVRLESRREIDWTARFPELERAAYLLGLDSALIDGEAAILLPDGKTSFEALQSSFEGGSRAGLVYYAFDLLWLDGEDFVAKGLPLAERKLKLERLIAGSSTDGVIRYSQHVVGNGKVVFAGAEQIGAEGIVSKRLDGPYLAGRREGWFKTKCVKREDFVIAGFTEPEGQRVGVGALLLGQHDGSGTLVFSGKVGTGPGFSADYLAELRRALESIEQSECPFAAEPPIASVGHDPRWVRPILVGTVEFIERSVDGVRHPSFQGFRSDKLAGDVRRR